jgi:hypothetical protein
MTKIKKPSFRTGKIPPKALVAQIDPDKIKYPVFSFLHVSESHCLLSEWQASEIDELIDTLKTIEQIEWDRIWVHKGLDVTKIPVSRLSIPLPTYVSEDETIYEFSVCSRKRIFGYRTNHNVLRIIWFDREHRVVPYRKNRKAR